MPSIPSDFARAFLGALALVAIGGCIDYAGPIPGTEPVTNTPAGGSGGGTAQPPSSMGGTTSEPPVIDPNLVSFSEDVHPILLAKCTPCHAEGGGLPEHGADDPDDAFQAVQGMSNDEPVYDRILARAAGQDGYMPPTSAGCEGPLGSLGCLTQAEYDTIALWVEQGAMNP